MPVDGPEAVYNDFADVYRGFKPAVRALFEQGVLDGTGCGDGALCPAGAIARWEFAVMMVRLLDGEDPQPRDRLRFTDVGADQWWAAHVERLAELGVTVGCSTGPLRFCPHGSVTRAETASFLVRSFEIDPAGRAGFTDIAGSVHARAIDAIYAAGITLGCDTEPLRYCPRGHTTREQTAALLYRQSNPA